MPVHVVEKLNKIGRVERKLVGEAGREPTSAEIALELELDVNEVEQIRRNLRRLCRSRNWSATTKI